MKKFMEFVVVGIVTSILIMGSVWWWTTTKIPPISERPVSHIRVYTVGKGDTAWSIAETFIPDDGDIREYIWELERLNGRKLSQLYPGDQIYITIYDEEVKR